jgi:hypothetical protein
VAIIRRVGPGSAFKVGLVLYALMGLLMGIFMACISMVLGPMGLGPPGVPDVPGAHIARLFMGAGAIIFLPIMYGVFGGIFAAIGAFVYNLVAGWVGGLEVDIS